MTTTLHSTPYPKDTVQIQQSLERSRPDHVFVEIEEIEEGVTGIAAITVPADALREAIDKAVPPTSKPFDIEAQLAESWERAEVGVPKEGDLLISAGEGGHEYAVWTSAMNYARSRNEIRIVKRAPEPEVQVLVDADNEEDFYIRIGPTRFMSVRGHADQQEAQLIEDGYVPAKVVAA